jgi:hypothetical protein
MLVVKLWVEPALRIALAQAMGANARCAFETSIRKEWLITRI